jgi:succinate dehydrogenase / fumarate reductase cytochrome b subunit
MLVSILHRATGIAMALGAASLFVWWLAAAASGSEAYETFHACATSPLGYLVAIGFTWTFFQHMFSGVRHLVLDTGAGYELRTNKLWALATLAGSISLTALVWALILARP